MNGGFAAFARKLERVQHDLSPEGFREQLDRVGRKLADEVDAAVKSTPAARGSLSDMSMSGWRRSRPIPITGFHKVTGDGIEVAPARMSRGPMRVLESGRASYGAGDRRQSGTRVRKKDGQRVDRYRKVKRNVGGTDGKGTWSVASGKVVAKATPMLHDEELRVMTRWFRRG